MKLRQVISELNELHDKYLGDIEIFVSENGKTYPIKLDKICYRESEAFGNIIELVGKTYD